MPVCGPRRPFRDTSSDEEPERKTPAARKQILGWNCIPKKKNIITTTTTKATKQITKVKTPKTELKDLETPVLPSRLRLRGAKPSGFYNEGLLGKAVRTGRVYKPRKASPLKGKKKPVPAPKKPVFIKRCGGVRCGVYEARKARLCKALWDYYVLWC